jgi:uncharacterized membrane protein YuzA (DUF378 family)
MYTEKMIFFIMMFLVIVGSLNWGLIGIFNFNLVEKFDEIVGANNKLSKFVYVLVGVCALWFLTRIDVFLPFLGDAAYPCDSLEEHVPENANKMINIKVPANVMVVYWAAEPQNDKMKTLPDYLEAYKNYKNTGIVRADANGNATLRFRMPSAYTVPIGKTLQTHVHYRYCKYPGMLSGVETVNL